MAGLKFHSFISDNPSTESALADVVDAAKAAEVGKTDLAFVFFTAHHREQALEVVETLCLEFEPDALVGVSAEGVIGGDVEIERAPGIAVLVGSMPDVRIHPFHIGVQDWQSLLSEPDKLIERIGVGQETRAVIGFGDPWTSPMNQFMQLLDLRAANIPLIGGMASSARQPGQNVLIRNDEAHEDGFVGVSLSGNAIDVQTVVSQGCRPIGKPMVITKAREDVIEQLGGKPAMQALHDTVTTLTESEQSLLRNGLFMGRAVSEYREKFGQGDFVIRNLTRIDEQGGTIAVADLVRVGQTVQFHLRDARTAHDDFVERLSRPSPPTAEQEAAALLFSCNGRGTNMFDASGHDVRCMRNAIPGAAIAGFFAAGEIGPVGGANFMHGHTASVAILRGVRQP